MAEKIVDGTPPTISGSLSELVGGVSEMFRLNILMLRAEMDQKAARAMRAAIALILGLAILVAAIFFGFFALHLFLIDYGMSPLFAAWLVAGSALAIGVAVVLFNLNVIMKLSPVPDRTIAEFARNMDVIKANIRSNDDV